nr:iron ABC transporter permease [Curvibacter sp. CHRR-16]
MALVLDVATGPAQLSPWVVVQTLLGDVSSIQATAIVWNIRLPAALTAWVVGAALGLSGALMQTILNNPLASGYTLGISAGASLGAASAIALGAWLPVPEAYAVPAHAMVFAALACWGVYALGGWGHAAPDRLVLAGIAMLFLFQALTSLVQLLASPEALQQIVFWLFGSLQKATWPKLGVMAVVLVLCIPWVVRDAWPLTALRMGDARAAALGVRLRSLRLRCLAIVSVLTGVAVAFVGTIGFVGLVAPHMARATVGEDQRWFLSASACMGGVLLSLASVASKTVYPGAVFPIGIVMALIGVPCFMLLVSPRRKEVL